MEEQKINKDLILREDLALARTVMANQRPFLSFLRTSLYFAIAGLSINSLITVKHEDLILGILWAFAIFLLVAGIVSYVLQRRKIEQSRKHLGNYRIELDD